MDTLLGARRMDCSGLTLQPGSVGLNPTLSQK